MPWYDRFRTVLDLVRPRANGKAHPDAPTPNERIVIADDRGLVLEVPSEAIASVVPGGAALAVPPPEVQRKGKVTPFASVTTTAAGAEYLTEFSKDQLWLKVWRRHPIVRASVAKIARIACNVGWDIEPREEGKEGREEDRAMLKEFFEFPNAEEGFAEILYVTIARLKVTGRCAWEVTRFENGLPASFYYLQGTITPIMDEHGNLQSPAYKQTLVTGAGATFEKDEVIFFRIPDPAGGLSGASDLESLEATITSDLFATSWLKNFWANDATRKVVYKLPSTLSDAQYRRAVEEIREKHAGVAQAHKPAVVLEGEVEITPIDVPPKDVGVLEERKEYRKEILAVLGPMPGKVGFKEDTAGGEMGSDDRSIIEEEVCPILTIVENRINHFIWTAYPERFGAWKFKFRKPPATDLRQAARIIDVLTKRGLATKNELRGMGGLAPIRGGDDLVDPQIPGLEEGVEPTIPQAREESAPIFAHDQENGVLTIDEIRRTKGLGPHPNRAFGPLTIPELKAKFPELFALPQRAEESAEANDDIPKPDAEDALAIRDRPPIIGESARFREGFKRETEKLFSLVRREVLSAWPLDDAKIDALSGEIPADFFKDFLLEELKRAWQIGRLDAEEEIARAQAKMGESLAARRAAGLRERAVGRNVPKKKLPALDKRTVETLERTAIDLSNVLVQHLKFGDRATKWYLKNRLADAVKKNLTRKETIESVQDLFKDLESWRAERLAMDMIGKAWNQAKRELAQEKGVSRCEIELGPNPCEWCLANSWRVQTLADADNYFDAHHHYVECKLVIRPDLKPLARAPRTFAPKD